MKVDSNKEIVRLLVLSFLFPALCFSDLFRGDSSRAFSMGGAQTGVADDEAAQYWNPAGFAKQKKYSFGIPVVIDTFITNQFMKNSEDANGVRASSSRVLDIVDSSPLLSTQQQDVKNFIRLMQAADDMSQNGSGVHISANTGAHMRVKNFQVSYVHTEDLNASAVFDFQNLGFNQATTGGTSVDDLDKLTAYARQNDPNFGNRTVSSASGQASIATDLTNSGIPAAAANQYANEIVYLAESSSGQYGFTKEQFVDLARNLADAAVAADPSRSWENNASAIRFKGAQVDEIALSYGYPQSFFEHFYVGGNLRMMRVNTVNNTIRLVEMFNQDQTAAPQTLGQFYDKAFTRSRKTTVKPAVDLGLMSDFNWLRVGLVGKYLNSPGFTMDGTGDLIYRPQVRVGFAFIPGRLWGQGSPVYSTEDSWEEGSSSEEKSGKEKIDRFLIALDVDATQNGTLIDGYDSRNIGGGVEWRTFRWFTLRGGIYKNVAESVPAVLTAGTTIRFFNRFSTGFSLAASPKTSSGVPENLSGAFNFKAFF